MPAGSTASADFESANANDGKSVALASAVVETWRNRRRVSPSLA
jgi:hypothetical protein